MGTPARQMATPTGSKVEGGPWPGAEGNTEEVSDERGYDGDFPERVSGWGSALWLGGPDLISWSGN